MCSQPRILQPRPILTLAARWPCRLTDSTYRKSVALCTLRRVSQSSHPEGSLGSRKPTDYRALPWYLTLSSCLVVKVVLTVRQRVLARNPVAERRVVMVRPTPLDSGAGRQPSPLQGRQSRHLSQHHACSRCSQICDDVERINTDLSHPCRSDDALVALTGLAGVAQAPPDKGEVNMLNPRQSAVSHR